MHPYLGNSTSGEEGVAGRGEEGLGGLGGVHLYGNYYVMVHHCLGYPMLDHNQTFLFY